jgi:hypothetical protein
MNEMMKLIAVMFLLRAKEHRDRKEFWGAIAYDNAFDWLCYGLEGNGACLSQFDGYDEAKTFIKEHPDLNMWAIENFIKGWEK